MPNRSRFDQLDAAIDAMLVPRDGSQAAFDPQLQTIVSLAADLRELPRNAFKAKLRAQLVDASDRTASHTPGEAGKVPERESAMATTTSLSPIREGFRTITPYLHPQKADRLIAFMKDAFDAELLLRVTRPDGSVMHSQLRIGDSMIEMGEPNAPFTSMPAALHLYVPNADATYERALKAGATSLHPMTDQPYGDREGCIRDQEGNNWYVATHSLTGGAPAGLHTITPYIHAQGADRVVDFTRRAFGAEVVQLAQSPDGVIHHAKLRIGDSVLEIGEAHGQWRPMPSALHLYVVDTDAVYDRVMTAGATSINAPADAPYGDRAATVRDPFGNFWYLATQIRPEAS